MSKPILREATIQRPELKTIMNRDEVIMALSKTCLLDNAIRAGWIKPRAYTGSTRPNSAIYAGSDVSGVIDRVLMGEAPPNSKGKGAK